MEETRTFSKDKDGNINVTVVMKDQEVYLPIDGEQKTVGTAHGTTHQIITEVDVFKKFLDEQLEISAQQIKELMKKLNELKDVNESIIPESILSDLSKYLSKKANKQTREKIKALNDYMTKIYNKRSYQRQLTKMTKMNRELVKQIKDLELIL